MAWVAVDSINRELIFRNEPFRDIDTDYMVTYHGWFDRNMNSWGVELPKGTIKKLIGRGLSWEDNPVELDTFGWKDIKNWDSYCVSTLGDILRDE